jgi:hypothetical protein
MGDEYPLYPTLTEQGEIEAQKIMDSFKPRLKSLMDDVMGELYCDVAHYIESDAWTNYRNKIMAGFENYGSGKPNHEYEYKQLRQAIYRNHKDEIIEDLNQDLVEENERLKKQNEELIETISNRRY